MENILTQVSYDTCCKLIEDHKGVKNILLSKKFDALVYKLNDNRIVMIPGFNLKSPGVVYKNVSILNNLIGIKVEETNENYFKKYSIDSVTFLNKKNSFLSDLKKRLSDSIIFDFSKASLQAIDTAVINSNLNSDKLIEPIFFIPLLFYVGETIIRHRNGKWILPVSADDNFVYIQFNDGEKINISFLLYKELSGNGYDEEISIQAFVESITG